MAKTKLKGDEPPLGVRNYGMMRLLTKSGWKKTQLGKCPGCGSKKGGKKGSMEYILGDFLWVKCANCGKFIVHRHDYTGWKVFDELPLTLKYEGQGAGTQKVKKKRPKTKKLT